MDSNVTVTWWQLVIGALATVLVPLVVARFTSRATVKVAQVTVEGGAFVRAEEIYKGAIALLKEENEKLRTDLSTEQRERKEEKAEMEGKIDELRRQVEAFTSKFTSDGTHIPQ